VKLSHSPRRYARVVDCRQHLDDAVTLENRNAIRGSLNLDGLRREYSVGIPNPALIKPEGYTLESRCRGDVVA
jgi:hypothetical protein